MLGYHESPMTPVRCFAVCSCLQLPSKLSTLAASVSHPGYCVGALLMHRLSRPAQLVFAPSELLLA
jgi:hypothetical protein